MKNPVDETYNDVQIEDVDCDQDNLAAGESFELFGGPDEAAGQDEG